MTSLWKKTNSVWKDNKRVYKKLSSEYPARIVAFDRFNDKVIEYVKCTNEYSYFVFNLSVPKDLTKFQEFYDGLNDPEGIN